MTINYATILPHGFDLIEELYPDVGEKWIELRNQFQNVAEEIVLRNPEIIILASPHNLRIENQIGIITSEWCEGIWWNENRSSFVELKWKCDREFGGIIYQKSQEINLPVVSINYGAAEGDLSAMKMDWGTLIPLWFIEKEYEKRNLQKPNFVLITPSREIPWTDLVVLGRLIEKISNEKRKNVVFIASCDHGHAHDPEGPYGFHQASKEFDEKICELIKNNKLSELMTFDPEFIDDAKPDSFWQMLILLGILEESNLKNSGCYYACPAYYGMIVADFKQL